MEIFSIVLFIVLILLYAAIIGLSIASYVLNAIGLSRVAAKKGVNNPWLAWIPVADTWVIGATADRIDAERGLERKWGKSLVILYIISATIGVCSYIGLFVGGIMIGMSESISSESMTTTAIVLIVVMYILLISVAFIAIVAQAFYYICLYKILENFTPVKAVKYLVLSMLIPMAMGICMMKCCPKKQEQVLPDSTEV